MSRMPNDVDVLAPFFDPVAVAAALHALCEAGGAAWSGPPGALPMPAAAGVATVADQEVLRRLLPAEAYAYWRQAGWLGVYCMSFMLRHAVTLLSLAAHARSCPAGDLAPVFEKYFSVACGARVCGSLDALAGEAAPDGRLPLLGFSALGIHVFYLPAGSCRAFDVCEGGCCAAPAAGLFCRRHAREAWWRYHGPGASSQACMFRFYAERDNLYAYRERQLEELVGRFWTRMKRCARWRVADDAAIAEALVFFDYASVADLRVCGQLKLRERYTTHARQLHPDSGGGHESFLRLRKHYDVLRNLLHRDLTAA